MSLFSQFVTKLGYDEREIDHPFGPTKKVIVCQNINIIKNAVLRFIVVDAITMDRIASYLTRSAGPLDAALSRD
ncbi:hypothetical protein JXQ70_14185 [bacterium]|nr:hypothetical protein [bacterium]